MSRRAAATFKGIVMLHYAVVFFLIAIVAAVFGFGGIAVGRRDREDPVRDLPRAVPGSLIVGL
jgi:amino acid transporter